jgi:hypothetical protein
VWVGLGRVGTGRLVIESLSGNPYREIPIGKFKPIMENSFSYNQNEMKLAIVIGCTAIVIMLIVITINYVCTLYVKVSVYSFIRF